MIGIAVAADGADWENEALDELERSQALTLARRCVDAADLLAICATGRARVALVDPGLAGLDLDVAERLRAAGARLVTVGEPTPWLGATAAMLGALDALAVVGEPAVVGSPTSGAPVVAVWGPVGAPGRTSVAVGLAASLARRRRVALVDADTRGGAVAQALGILDDVSGVMAACRDVNAGRPIGDPAVLAVHDRLAVVTGIPRPEDMWHHLRPAALTAVLDELSSSFDVVVTDAGSGCEPPLGAGPGRDQATTAVLSRADETVVVGRAEPLGLARLLRCLDAGATSTAPRIVINYCRASLGWSEHEVNRTIRQVTGLEAAEFLPLDQQAHDLAAVRGAAVRDVAPASPWATRLDRFADSLAEDLLPTLVG